MIGKPSLSPESAKNFDRMKVVENVDSKYPPSVSFRGGFAILCTLGGPCTRNPIATYVDESTKQSIEVTTPRFANCQACVDHGRSRE